MRSREEKAAQKFSAGCNCARFVFSTFAAGSGITEEIALKIPAGFGAGMSRLQEACGAVGVIYSADKRIACG